MTKGGLRIISAAGWGKRKIGRSEEERGKRERGGGGGEYGGEGERKGGRVYM